MKRFGDSCFRLIEARLRFKRRMGDLTLEFFEDVIDLGIEAVREATGGGRCRSRSCEPKSCEPKSCEPKSCEPKHEREPCEHREHRGWTARRAHERCGHEHREHEICCHEHRAHEHPAHEHRAHEYGAHEYGAHEHRAHEAQSGAAAEPSRLLLEGPPGSSVKAAFGVENTLSTPVVASFRLKPSTSAFTNLARFADSLSFSPEEIALQPKEQAIVKVTATIPEAMEANVSYRGDIEVVGLPASVIPIVVRRQSAV